MLRRTHVVPFLRVEGDALVVDPLRDSRTSLVPFLDRLMRLVRRLEGRPRRVVTEAIRRQERRVRDVRRLAGLGKTLLDACVFRPGPGAEGASAIRQAVFLARGRRWPPVPGDADQPYLEAARELDLRPDTVRGLMYADRADRYRLVRAPSFDGAGLLERYNLELARAVLLDAEAMTFRASGGWKRVFRSLKLARLMYDVRREGRRRYRVEITGPAAAYVVRPRRYGIRFARAVPSLLAAPGGRIEARVHHQGRSLSYALDARDVLKPGRRRVRYDSSWERDLAEALRQKIGESRKGWTLIREDAPVVLPGGGLFLPDFTLRHRDGREALVEVVGFWTPEYLEEKLRKVRAAGAPHLVLVVSRRLRAGTGDLAEVSRGPVVWFTDRPIAGPVLAAAERVARPPTPRV